MSYGIIEYNPNGLPKCEICGKYFARVLTHVRQKHFMTEREYKIMFGLDLKKGITSEESKEKSRRAALNNFDSVIAENLLKHGNKCRFKKGHKGRTSDQVSEQTRIMLTERARNTMTTETRKQKGKELGLSGKGNATRWRQRPKQLKGTKK